MYRGGVLYGSCPHTLVSRCSGIADGPRGAGEFNDPRGVTTLADGSFIVTEYVMGGLRRVMPDGSVRKAHPARTHRTHAVFSFIRVGSQAIPSTIACPHLYTECVHCTWIPWHTVITLPGAYDCRYGNERLQRWRR